MQPDDRPRIRACVLEELQAGEAYSTELRNAIGIDWSMQRLRHLLVEMEREGLIASRVVPAPQSDGGQMARRYYRLA